LIKYITIIRKQLLITILLIVIKSSFAQSDFDLSQRFFNEAIYNPAATGSSFTTSVFMHARAQWVGLEGAPTTEVISFDTYLDNIRSGIGVTITGDQIGFTNTYSARFSYAYNLPLGKVSLLSFGLSAALLNRNQNASGALVDDLTDGTLYYGDVSENTPDFDFGIEYKGPLKIGVSVRHIGPNIASPYFRTYAMNVWSYASTKVNLAKTTVEPMISHVYREKYNRYEAGALVYYKKTRASLHYNDKYWIGAMWRFHGQYAAIAGISLTPQLRLGYSFDYAIGELSQISELGTHEIFVSWQFNRALYNEPHCPAYRERGADAKKKKKFMKEVTSKFNIY